MPSSQTHQIPTAVFRRWMLVAFVLLHVGALSMRAGAQPPASAEPSDTAEQTSAGSEGETIVAPPGAMLTPASDPYDTRAVWRAENQVKRARNGLIATSAAFGVGWIFMGSAASQCNRDMNNEFQCNNAGRVLGTIGMISASGGLVGMIVTGILLPVRQKKERDLRRSIHQRQPARLRWDVESGKVRF